MDGSFRRLWAAQTISELGSQVTLLALPLTAVLVLHASAFEVAVLTGIEYVPFLLLGVPAGVWVDRLPLRSVLAVTDLGRAALLASIPAAYALDALTLAHLYAIAFAAGALTVFFSLAYAAYVPALVARDDLVAANGRLEATRSAAFTAGPAAGGGLVAAASAPVALLADAASFAFSGLLVLSIRERGARAEAQPGAAGFRAQLRAGARIVLREQHLRAVLLSSAVANFGFNVSGSLFLVFGVRELGLGAGLLGVVLAVGEGGGLLGAVLASRIARRVGVGPTLIGSATLFLPSTLAIALAPRALPVPFLVAGWLGSSFARVVYGVMGVSIRQALVPQELLGRVVGFTRFVIYGVVPLGSLAGGAVAATAGLRTALVVGSVLGSCALLPLVASPLRSLRTLPPALDLR